MARKSNGSHKEMAKFYWQNLAYLKCPKCHSKFIEKDHGFECPDHRTTCDFYIPRAKMIRILTDGDHPALKYLDEFGKKELNSTLVRVGIIDMESGQGVW